MENMEFNQIKIKDAAGKTIESVVLSDIDYELLIKYTDGSFSFLQCSDDGIPDIILKYQNIVRDVYVNTIGNVTFDSEIRFLIENGIVDKEKLSIDAIEKNKTKIESQQNQEYQTYLKLKEKFDGESN